MSSADTGRVSFGYRPALDGLRALAVTAVVLYHAGITGLGGGFLGVDTFFVLSGFLITSLLLTERLAHGRIDLPRFWIRRARRLLPALLVMVVATVVAGRWLLDPDALGLLRTDAWAALAYLANWRMIFRGTGYVAATAAPSPLQHTWSLGIEEQFYLIWPLVVAGLIGWVAARHTRTVLVVLCGAGAIASQLACGLVFQPDDIARAYYGTDTRAQALLIGAALAAVLTRPAAPSPGRRGRLALGVLGAAGAAATGLLWHFGADQAAWLYRGGLTAAALGTALMILPVMIVPGAFLARLLGFAPLVWLGRISYGVYLWHWPLFSYLTADSTGLSRWPLLALRLAATLAAAVLSYHLIEMPIRHGVLGRSLPRRVPVAVAAATVAVTAVVIAYAATPPPAPVTTAAPVVITTVPAAPHLANRRVVAPRPAPIDRPGRPGAGREPRVIFLGDSVSWVIGTYLPAHPGMWTSVRAIQGCGIATLPDILQLGTRHTNYPGCTSWQKRWQRGVAEDQPDVAVIELNRWELMDRRYQGRYQHVGDPAYDRYLTAQLDRAIDIAGSRGAAVVLLTAAYTHRAEKPDGSLYPEDQPGRVDAWNRLLRATAARHRDSVTVLDLNPVVCPDGKFTWKIDGRRVRSDGLHYTPAAVQRIIAPWLLPELAAIANGTYPRATAPGD
ncbi:acyltransferase family protein [Paractinoplanes toevensis]|uniref:Membrane protein n=1 Tax=Paractinoplanes toevensis TaxID=571911 RepID=A0A919TDV7_9ACTN|nr:acyltransferase family protein [Actinoplanes toevensis]GIM93628.1 membrane protein [Actinoplanes toevensis]